MNVSDLVLSTSMNVEGVFVGHLSSINTIYEIKEMKGVHR